MPLSHVHNCRHCDKYWTCRIVDCTFPIECSKWHDCGERELNRRRMVRLMQGYVECKYGCKSLPCVHDKWPGYQDIRLRAAASYHRPRVVEFGGRMVVLSNENSHTLEQYKKHRHETTHHVKFNNCNYCQPKEV